jgi:hypothetical protein
MSQKKTLGANLSGQQDCGETQPKSGAIVITACGGRINYSTDTPCACFRGEAVYFCLPICKKDYENDPYTSCLAASLLDSGAR